jgi:hypothetical protein
MFLVSGAKGKQDPTGVVGINRDCVTGTNIRTKDVQSKRIGNGALDYALERTCSKLNIVAPFTKPVHAFLRYNEVNSEALEARCNICDLQFSDTLHFGRNEWLE